MVSKRRLSGLIYNGFYSSLVSESNDYHMQLNLPITPKNLVEDAINCIKQGQRIALITLVNIEGNAPYPIGSQMLVNQRGEFWGQITGGCAETALAEHAVLAINQRKNETHRYGLNSPYFDIQLPCGSGIDVYFDVTLTLESLLDLNNRLVNRSMARQHLDTGVGRYQKSYLPTERLLIFGQGPIQISLAILALASGFEVICFAQDVDSAERLLEAGIKPSERLPNNDDIVFGQSDRYTAMLSLFHEHELETELLVNALRSDLFYIGALGSRATHSERLKKLRRSGVSESMIARVHGPVGLNIGASTPAQIAISILAQLIEILPKPPR